MRTKKNYIGISMLLIASGLSSCFPKVETNPTNVTKSKMEELNKTHENKLGVYNDLLHKEEKDLWKDDLNKFLEIYKVNLEKYNKIMNDQINKDNKEVKKIKKVKKTTTK